MLCYKDNNTYNSSRKGRFLECDRFDNYVYEINILLLFFNFHGLTNFRTKITLEWNTPLCPKSHFFSFCSLLKKLIFRGHARVESCFVDISRGKCRDLFHGTKEANEREFLVGRHSFFPTASLRWNLFVVKAKERTPACATTSFWGFVSISMIVTAVSSCLVFVLRSHPTGSTER